MVGNYNLSDKEITNAVLGNHKLSATSLTNLILESSNNQLRTDCMDVLKRTLENQKQLFDVMSQKGWYQVANANQQDLSQAQQAVSNITASI
ncbi:MAG: spore coat protein [Deltaproteobacteria bacterium]